MRVAALVLLVVAVALGLLGLAGVVPEGRAVARVLLLVFLALFVLAVLRGAARRGPPTE